MGMAMRMTNSMKMSSGKDGAHLRGLCQPGDEVPPPYTRPVDGVRDGGAAPLHNLPPPPWGEVGAISRCMQGLILRLSTI